MVVVVSTISKLPSSTFHANGVVPQETANFSEKPRKFSLRLVSTPALDTVRATRRTSADSSGFEDKFSRWMPAWCLLSVNRTYLGDDQKSCCLNPVQFVDAS